MIPPTQSLEIILTVLFVSFFLFRCKYFALKCPAKGWTNALLTKVLIVADLFESTDAKSIFPTKKILTDD